MSNVQTSLESSENVKRGRGRPAGSGAKKYRYNGKTLTLREWAEALQISYMTLYMRVEVNKMRTRDAFVRPLYARKTTKENTLTMQ
jgi:hypothetical protein